MLVAAAWLPPPVHCKACKIGLESRIKWSDEEIEKLKIEYPYHLND